jgi:hypothetical protein
LDAIFGSILLSIQFLFNNLVAVPSCLRISPPVQEISDEEADRILSASLDETALLPADLGQSGFDVLPDGEHTQARPVRTNV